jgi:SNF2 family DNA or RNA helicase
MNQSYPASRPSKNAEGSRPARFSISVSEAAPWPALKVCVQAIFLNAAVPVDQLTRQGNVFCYKDLPLKVETLDGLLLRNLMQQPKADESSYLVNAREFASTLALLRQHSNACGYQESPRVAAVKIFSESVEPVLELKPGTGGEYDPSGASALKQVVAQPRYRCPASGKDFGQPLFRGANYWTFDQAVCPPPQLPADDMIRKVFNNTREICSTFAGEDALEIIFRARNAYNQEQLLLRLDPILANADIARQPLKERVKVAFDQAGNVNVSRQIVTPEGQVLDPEAIAPSTSEIEKESAWVNVAGRAYRRPASAAAFRLPAERKISGDAIPDFLQQELPQLKQAGAAVEADVSSATICSSLKPGLHIDAANPEQIQARLTYEATVAKETGTEAIALTPSELIEAAARGERFVRRGNTFIAVDGESVQKTTRQLAEIAEAGDRDDFVASEEQIPELLTFARSAARDVNSPWNLYVASHVEGAQKINDDAAKVRFNLDVEEEEDGTWFTLNATFDHAGEQLDEDALRKLVKKGKKWFKKGDTWVKVDAAALEKFELSVQQTGVRRTRGRRRKFYYRFRPAERERVTDIFSLSGTLQHAETYKLFLNRLGGYERIEPLPMPKGMTLTLRPYQQQGYEWLCFLAHYGLNGILADDMGLGKTAQTIALITRLKQEDGPMPVLIVTPTSLVENWRNEIAKFSPNLNVLIYRGSPQRRDKLRQEITSSTDAPESKSAGSKSIDVIIGTYATIRNDASLLREIDWRYVILDEAHFIKNSAAATTKAIKTIPARHRLALTGTPIQNRLTELWSLFDFLMPEFLGRQMRFRENYEDPIARMQSGRAETQEEFETGKNALETLRERIKPFVLRRLKTDVASELPPKIENDIFCRLAPEQVALYKSFSDSAEAKEAVNELVTKGADRATTAILAALMSLRKICNHPDLMCLPKNAGRQRVTEPMEGYEHRSGKLEALGELLDQCDEGGHRALIFCQLTTMLDIIGIYLKQRGMKYLRLDGETPSMQRQALVDQFNKDTSLQAFLISTRAGGTGLNLTGADTVIFYDHDWNPANDQQAQDRAYRIGQQRTVNVYRLICKGTLEEKILRRQAQKRMLASSIVTHDVTGMKELTREDLLSLFTLVEE